MAAVIDAQQRVISTAQQIVRNLETSGASADDMISILRSFDNRLSNITSFISDPDSAAVTSERVDTPFEAAEKVILQSDSKGESDWIWEDSPEDTSEYLGAVDEIIQLTEESGEIDAELMDRAENALQMAMSRLEEEFRHILIRNTVVFNSERLQVSIRRVSIASNDGEIEDFESYENDDEGSSTYGHERGASLGDDLFSDLLPAKAVVGLREIADRMIRSGYEKECCQVYSSVRRDVLDECLSVLDVERLSIDEVQRIEWRALDEKMKKWVQAIKIVVRVLLSCEKRLCEEVFCESELIKEVCFVETAKGCVMQLLNFGEAVVIARRASEKLFRILDMYDALADVLPNLEELFCEESGDLVCSEANGLLSGLGEAAIGTFVEFENAVKGETSKKPIQGGEIHPLCRYVMNYVKLLVDYHDLLNVLLGQNVDESSHLQNIDESSHLQNDDEDLTMTLLGYRLMSLISTLQSNLEEKSRLYEDNAMRCIFLMNNMLYIVRKVKDSEIIKVLGKWWVRVRRGEVRRYSTSYLRIAWSKALSCLKDEGIGGSTSNASKMALKERFKNFNACFEDIYRTQTAWKVPDAQLREELRISISEAVIPAYRSFVGRFGSQLESGRHAGKYIKYNADDLENYLSDLFEGTPLTLNITRRRST